MAFDGRRNMLYVADEQVLVFSSLRRFSSCAPTVILCHETFGLLRNYPRYTLLPYVCDPFLRAIPFLGV
jgi:hypothetical protein